MQRQYVAGIWAFWPGQKLGGAKMNWTRSTAYESCDPDRIAQEAASAKRTWWAFRIAVWTLACAGSVLILAGLFWPGAIGLLSAAAVAIVWQDWSRRGQARFDAIAPPGDQ
jgi:hypothetical protein